MYVNYRSGTATTVGLPVTFNETLALFLGLLQQNIFEMSAIAFLQASAGFLQASAGNESVMIVNGCCLSRGFGGSPRRIRSRILTCT